MFLPALALGCVLSGMVADPDPFSAPLLPAAVHVEMRTFVNGLHAPPFSRLVIDIRPTNVAGVIEYHRGSLGFVAGESFRETIASSVRYTPSSNRAMRTTEFGANGISVFEGSAGPLGFLRELRLHRDRGATQTTTESTEARIVTSAMAGRPTVEVTFDNRTGTIPLVRLLAGNVTARFEYSKYGPCGEGNALYPRRIDLISQYGGERPDNTSIIIIDIVRPIAAADEPSEAVFPANTVIHDRTNNTITDGTGKLIGEAPPPPSVTPIGGFWRRNGTLTTVTGSVVLMGLVAWIWHVRRRA